MSYGAGTSQGWGPDPFGHHEARWFSWGQATGLVRDGIRETFDPVPTEVAPPQRPVPMEETPPQTPMPRLVASPSPLSPPQTPMPRLVASPTALPPSAAPLPPSADSVWAPGAATSRTQPTAWPTAWVSQVPEYDPWQAPAPETGRRSRFRWVAAAVALVLVAGVVTAIVTRRHTSPPNPAVLIAGASNATTATQTAHFSTTTKVSGLADENFQVLQSGDENFTSKTAQMKLDVAGQSETLRLVGGNIYVEVPSVLSLPNGAHWVEVTPQDLGTSASTSSLGAQDPAQGLQFLGGMVGSPVVAGTGMIDGVKTTHYRIVLNLQAAFAKVANAEGHLLPGMGQISQSILGNNQLTAIPAEVWLDSADRVRRLTFTLNLQLAGQTLNEVSTIDFSSFGAPVVVNAPAPSDTVPFSAVIGELGGSASHLID